SLGLSCPFDGDVVDFVPPVQMAQHLQSADLSALGGRVHEIGVDPQGLHTAERAAASRPSQCRSRLPVRKRSPQSWKFSRRQMRSVLSSCPDTWRSISASKPFESTYCASTPSFARRISNRCRARGSISHAFRGVGKPIF